MYRRRSALTQPELAALLGFRTKSKVVAYERSAVRRAAIDLLTFQIVFGAPLEQLLEGEYVKARRIIHRRVKRLLDRVVRSQKSSSRLDRKLLFLRSLLDRTTP
jgi:transcriptional regulator with XRE-family HTH domain